MSSVENRSGTVPAGPFGSLTSVTVVDGDTKQALRRLPMPTAWTVAKLRCLAQGHLIQSLEGKDGREILCVRCGLAIEKIRMRTTAPWALKRKMEVSG